MANSLSSELESLELLAKGQLPAEAVGPLADRLADDRRLEEVVAALSRQPGSLVDALRRRPKGADPAADRLVDNLLRRLGDGGSLDGTFDNTEAFPHPSPSQPAPALLHLDTFKIEKILGQGGMGTVYLAQDTRLGRQVAIKTLKRELAERPGAVDRFLREARTAARVEHDHVCPIYQVGEADGTPYIAMPFLKGEPLDARLKRERPLPIPEAIRIGREIALGLAAAQDVGLIHRDIKPANVWMETVRGRAPRARILDFGLARAQADEGELTASGVILGTPAYMAPEQARGLKVDARADLWSLGVMLYEMAVGRRPFTGGDTMAILTSLAMDTPTPAHEANPAVPVELSALIGRLLSKNVDGRPGDGQEVADELQRIQTHATLPGIEALPAGPPAVSRTAATLVDPWGGIEDADAVPAAAPAKAARPAKAATPAKRFPMPLAVALGLVVLLGGAFGVYKLAMKPKEEIAKPGPDGQPDRQVVTAPTKKDPVKPVMDPDRRAAEYVLSVGGHIGINDVEKEIYSAANLPKEAFRLTYIFLRGKQVTDAGLANFQGCKNLTAILLGLNPVTDAGLANFKDCKNLTTLHLNGTKIGGAGLANFKDCKNLTTLILDGTEITDAGLAHVKDCKSLTYLDVDDTKVTDVGLANFKECMDLTALRLNNTPVSDVGLANFRKCKNLTELRLHGAPVGDAGLAYVKECKLERLELGGTKVSDAGLTQLTACQNLTALDLEGTPVTDAGLAHFKVCKNLRVLYLTATAVSDASLPLLQSFDRLNGLRVNETKITPEGVKQLAAKLPNCRIEHDGGVIAPSAADPDRQAAETITRHVTLVVRLASGKLIYSSVGQPLPAEPFTLEFVVMYGGHPKPPKEFVRTALLPAVGALKNFNGFVDNDDRLGFTDEDLTVLAGLPCAGWITNLPPVNPTARVWEALRNFPKLTLLDVRAAALDNDGLKALASKLPPTVRQLGFISLGAGGKVDPDGFKAVTNLPLMWVSLYDCKIFSRDMAKALAAMPSLRNVSVTGVNTERGWVEDLCQNRDLGHLEFAGSNVTDEDLAYVAKLKNVRHVSLHGTNVTAAGVKKIADAHPKAEIRWEGPDRKAAEYVLSVGGLISLDGGGEFKTAADLPKTPFQLRICNLNGNKKLTPEGLANFAGCKNLSVLYLAETGLTDAGLATFKDGVKLTDLALNDTAVTDASVPVIQGFAGLTRLNVKKTKLTADGVKHLAEKLPKCTIEHDGGVIEPKK